MRVLVIGGMSGQVTRELAALNDPTFKVIVLGRAKIDLAEASTISAAISDVVPDVVILSGAYTAVDQAETEQAAAYAINAEGPGVVGAACAAADIPVVHLSTDYVFDGTKAEAYSEADETGPLTVYGATKLRGETAIAASGARHVILRVSWIHAPEGTNFVRTMLRLARTRERINVVADQIGRPTYAPHLAIALRNIAARLVMDPDTPTGVFHLTGSGEPCSWHQFAEAIFAASHVRGGPSAMADPIPASAYPTPAKRPANSVLDCTRIAETYGLILPTWKQGVEECVEAIRLGGWQVA